MAVQDYVSIQNYIRSLINNGVDSLCIKPIRLENQFSGVAADLTTGGENVDDIFTLLLCIAGETIKWQILFDSSNPENAPDVLILSENGFDPDYEQISSLKDWKSNDSGGLLNVIKELVREYKFHQIRRCSQVNSDLSHQIKEVAKNYEKVEVSLSSNEKAGKVISVMIEMNLNIEKTEETSSENAWVLNQPALVVKYEHDQHQKNPLIYLPPFVERMIGGRTTLNPPAFNDSDKTLLEYVDMVRDQLISYTTLLVESQAQRKLLIQAILKALTGNVIEYDAKDFLKISLLFRSSDFSFIVHVMMSRTFPRDQPVLTFESGHHLTRRNQLFQMTCDNYPYNTKWSADELTEQIRALIIEKAGIFEDRSHQNVLL